MTPEERVNQYYWWALEHIKEEILTTPSNKLLVYELSHIAAPGVPSNDTEANIIRKLHEWKAIKIAEESPRDWRGSGRHVFKFKIIEPKFTEIYNKYKELCDGIDQETKASVSNKLENQKEKMTFSIQDIPIKIVIADLKSKYREIEQEKNSVQFFIKIAHYGKYILENESTIITLSPLYADSKEGAKPYLNAWKKFIEIWKIYAKDLLEKAEEAGIKNDPNPLSNEIANIESRLNNKETYLWESDLANYYNPYQRLIWKFNELNKADLLVPKHEDAENNIVIYPIYNKGLDEWDKFKYSREASVWWAHYQTCRLAAGVLGLEISKDYFKKNRVIDAFYKFEFDEVARGNINRSPIVLHQDKFATWIKRLHEYLMPRLETMDDKQPILKQSSRTQSGQIDNHSAFDSHNNKIKLAGKDIPIPKNTDQFELCRVIFENQSSREREWSSGDLLEKWGSNYEGNEVWRKVYNAAREVNQKVAAKTTIEDFLIIKTYTTQLNPKYL